MKSEQKKRAVLTQKQFLNNGLQKFESKIAPYLVENGFDPIYHEHRDPDAIDYPFSRTVSKALAGKKIREHAEEYDQIFLPVQNRLTVDPAQLDCEIVAYVHDIYPYTAHLYSSNHTTVNHFVNLVQSMLNQDYMDNLVNLDKVIAASELTKKDLEQRTTFNGEIEVVSQGVEGGLDTPPPKEKNRDIDLLYVGTLRERKNPDFIREAFRKAERQGYTVASVNYNGLDLPGENFENVSEDKLRELYQRTRYYLHPTYLEGFGRGAVEAQRQGAVPLGLDNEINHEILGREGSTWFETESPSDAVRKLSDDIPYGVRRMAWENSCKYDWNKKQREILEVLQD